MLTGDAPVVTACVCGEVGLEPGSIMLGKDIAELGDTRLERVC